MDFKKIFLKEACPTKIGGQAVMEGVMMRSPTLLAVAIRLETGRIKIKTKPLPPKSKISKVPIIRGIFAFVNSMVEGTKILMYSAQVLEESEKKEAERKVIDNQNSADSILIENKGKKEKLKEPKFEKWLEKNFGEKAVWTFMIYTSVILAIIVTVGLFILFPTFIVSLFSNTISSTFLLNLIEGCVRITLFVLYVLAISRMEDIKKVFEYHGAEHKTIHCYENGLELTPENAQTFYTLHPRCGTSFLMFVMIISLILFSLFGWPNLWLRVLSRIILIPFVAGLSYELLKLAGNGDNFVVKILSIPGLYLQKLTTREPSKEQLEVAIAAMKAVMIEKDNRMTVNKTLHTAIESMRKAGIAEADHDSRELLAYVLETEKMQIPLMYSDLVEEEESELFFSLITRRIEREPIQYIMGKAYLMGHEFYVDSNVLIPRQDTETLIEEACKIIKSNSCETILDLCTGSGAIGICLAKEATDVKVVCSDISESALDIAKRNAQLLKVADRITFVQGDLLRPFEKNDNEQELRKFSLIVSNPPYIKSEEMNFLESEVRDNEPALALDGGSDGLDYYRKIIYNSPYNLEENGHLILEIGCEQKEEIFQLLKESNMYAEYYAKQDLAGRDRVVVARV